MIKININEASTTLNDLYKKETNKTNQKKLNVLILLKIGDARNYEDLLTQTGYSRSTITKYISTYRQYGLDELLKIKTRQKNKNYNEVLTSDGYVILYENFFTQKESQKLFLDLFNNISWRQDTIKKFGKLIPLPRLTAWYGNLGKTYTYSGITMNPLAWTPQLLNIKHKIEKVTSNAFNSVLLNQYRNGKDSVAWHSDNEPELGEEPIIASVSFGATRQFTLKHKFKIEIKPIALELTSGSLLLMKGQTQKCWLHQVPKTQKEVKARINLTFRTIF